jgi:hypothetical protein
LPAPQGLSQATTSFIGSRCQGIHHVPLHACQTNTQQTQHVNTGQGQSTPTRTTRTTTITRTSFAQRHTLQNIQPTHPCGLMLASTINKSNTKKPTNHTAPIQEPLGLMPQGPTVCQSQPIRTPTTFHTQHGRTAPCRTSDKPPSEKTFHRRFHYPNTTICLRHTRPERGACSLERR